MSVPRQQYLIQSPVAGVESRSANDRMEHSGSGGSGHLRGVVLHLFDSIYLQSSDVLVPGGMVATKQHHSPRRAPGCRLSSSGTTLNNQYKPFTMTGAATMYPGVSSEQGHPVHSPGEQAVPRRFLCRHPLEISLLPRLPPSLLPASPQLSGFWCQLFFSLSSNYLLHTTPHTPSTTLLVQVHSGIYDLSDLAECHPGGAQVLWNHQGRDASVVNELAHHSQVAREEMRGRCVWHRDWW